MHEFLDIINHYMGQLETIQNCHILVIVNASPVLGPFFGQNGDDMAYSISIWNLLPWDTN